MKRRNIRHISLVLLSALLITMFSGCAAGEPHTHQFGQWEVQEAATCTKEGTAVHRCSCGEKETQAIPPSHGEGEWVTTKEPTFTKDGSRELRCEHCGYVLAVEILPAEQYTGGSLQLPSKDKSYTICILTQRPIEQGYYNNADSLWFFRYMEHWFYQQGYTVNIQVQTSNDMEQIKKLALNTDTLPDLMWGVELTNEEIVRFALEEGMMLEWTPFVNASLMPNLYKLFTEQPASKTLSTAPNDGIYGLPYINASLYSSGTFGLSERLYFRQSWLDQIGAKNPTTKEELLSVLRAFKTQITDKTTDKYDVPLVSADGFLEKYLWTCMGFYGGELDRFGASLAIHDGQLVLPAYTESYRDFVTIMKTMYDEDLIPKDFFASNGISVGAKAYQNQCGAMAWSTLESVEEKFADFVSANPIPIGDVTSVDDIHVSLQNSVYPNYIWASSKYQEPRILAMLIDFIYSEQGAMLYRYGPQAGQDPLGMVDGWYYDADGNVTTQKVVNGECTSMTDYGLQYLYPNDYVGLHPALVTSGSGKTLVYTDSVTGKPYSCIEDVKLSHDTNDGHWRLTTMEKWSDRATTIRVPNIFLPSDWALEYADYGNALYHWIESETCKFITGVRPVSEIDVFWKELEQLGVAEYLRMANQSLEDWLEDTFK